MPIMYRVDTTSEKFLMGMERTLRRGTLGGFRFEL